VSRFYSHQVPCTAPSSIPLAISTPVTRKCGHSSFDWSPIFPSFIPVFPFLNSNARLGPQLASSIKFGSNAVLLIGLRAQMWVDLTSRFMKRSSHLRGPLLSWQLYSQVDLLNSHGCSGRYASGLPLVKKVSLMIVRLLRHFCLILKTRTAGWNCKTNEALKPLLHGCSKLVHVVMLLWAMTLSVLHRSIVFNRELVNHYHRVGKKDGFASQNVWKEAELYSAGEEEIWRWEYWHLPEGFSWHKFPPQWTAPRLDSLFQIFALPAHRVRLPTLLFNVIGETSESLHYFVPSLCFCLCTNSDIVRHLIVVPMTHRVARGFTTRRVQNWEMLRRWGRLQSKHRWWGTRVLRRIIHLSTLLLQDLEAGLYPNRLTALALQQKHLMVTMTLKKSLYRRSKWQYSS